MWEIVGVSDGSGISLGTPPMSVTTSSPEVSSEEKSVADVSGPLPSFDGGSDDAQVEGAASSTPGRATIVAANCVLGRGSPARCWKSLYVTGRSLSGSLLSGATKSVCSAQ